LVAINWAQNRELVAFDYGGIVSSILPPHSALLASAIWQTVHTMYMIDNY
jgi:hypothetical protein